VVANVSAKRAARAHFIFNIFGVIWILILFYPVIKLINYFMIQTGSDSPMTNTAAIPVALSVFHTLFNVMNTFVMVWFVRLIERVVVKIVPDKESDEEFRLKYINTGMLSTSELAILQARKEIYVYGERVTKMFGFVRELFLTEKDKKFEKLAKKIEKYEEIADRMEVEIADYLAKVSEGELSESASLKIRAMFEIIDNIESIGDSSHNLERALVRKREGKMTFPDDINRNILEMFDLIDTALAEMLSNLEKDFSEVNIDKAYEIENDINNLRNKLREEHILNVKAKKYKYKVGVLYNELFSSCEKLGDYIINVSESIRDSQIS